MKIPKRNIEKFVRELVDQCTVSQRTRIQRGQTYQNFALYGAEQPQGAAIFNKTWTYLGDLQSLMYSPATLRFNIADPDNPNVINMAKGRSAAARLRTLYRQSETDTGLSMGTFWGLVKGKAFVKQDWKRGLLSPTIVQPEAMGVLNEGYDKLDEDMEAFCFSSLLTPYQFARLVWDRRNKDYLIIESKRYLSNFAKDDYSLSNASQPMQVVVGGLYPYQPAGQGSNTNRGIVDWLASPNPMIDTKMAASMLRLDELWVWDDDREDWATFQIVGEKMLIFGDVFTANKMAWNPQTGKEARYLKGQHPYREICPNPVSNYFWGRSEVINIMLLQYALNQRLNGINRLLRKQEDPPKKFTGTAGVNQQVLSRFNKPGGYWSDTNPNAKLEELVPTIPADLWNDFHEIERMFDEMGGLPPVARGRGEAGVRGAGHAETLIRMATPRLKDSSLLIERDVEGVAALSLDLAKAHSDKALYAWVDPAAAGEIEMPKEIPKGLVAPVPGTVPIVFRMADLDEDLTVSVDSHSSSPAFQQEARQLIFDLVKISAYSPSDAVERLDVTDSEGVLAEIGRREAAQAAEIAKLSAEDPAAALKLVQGGRKK